MDDESTTLEEEKIANNAAVQFVVPNDELEDYLTRVNPYFFAETTVLGFAARLGVHPGLVVGRLQNRLEKSNYITPYKFLRSYLVRVRHILTQSAPTDGWSNVHPISSE
jgi:HTH-type transcriptional regulator/antitoxin HigA